MKKLLLLTGVSAVSLAAFAADSNYPLKFNNAFIQAISPNGKYAVSNLYDTQITIFDIEADRHTPVMLKAILIISILVSASASATMVF